MASLAEQTESLNSLHVLVLLSGGIDSTTCVEYYVSRHYDVSALFIDYGQSQSEEEFAAATAVAEHYEINLKRLAVAGYTVADEGYIPARNAVLLILALMSCEFERGLISLGIHSGTPYVDCSPEFEQAIQRVFDVYVQGRIRIDAPFAAWTKSEIWGYAKMQQVPLHLTCSNNLADLGSAADELRP